ncbi:MAG: TIGR02281 family clan AA aspartic protease [Gammaproteobacteria bacterium]|nr:TIGR02281 family clan AA aspartic protease [Gammaproteobacteria bacterium]
MKIFLHVLLLMLVAFQANAQEQIQQVKRVAVQALFTGKAMVSIDGQRRVLSVGKPSPEGVVLISANSDGAVLEVNGKQSTYPLGSEVGTNFSPVTEMVEQIFPDTMGMYTTVGSINGLTVKFLVDTGATLIAMNEYQAKRLGIDFRLRGKLTQVATASDIKRAYQVKLNTVKLGKITLRNVDAVVMEGTQPNPALLGMSFLGRLKMGNNGAAMVLTHRP